LTYLGLTVRVSDGGDMSLFDLEQEIPEIEYQIARNLALKLYSGVGSFFLLFFAFLEINKPDKGYSVEFFWFFVALLVVNRLASVRETRLNNIQNNLG
jgi:hypothetical protein